MSNAPTIFTPEGIDRVIAMRLAGVKNAEIAAAIGTTKNSLAARMSQLGISKPRTKIAA